MLVRLALALSVALPVVGLAQSRLNPFNLAPNTPGGLPVLDGNGHVPPAQLPLNLPDGVPGLDSNGHVPPAQLPIGQPNGVSPLDANTRPPTVDVVNPKDAKWLGGAKGNYNPATGTGTDDTAAINAAAASLTNGGTVLLQGGNFGIAGIDQFNAVLLPSNVKLECDGGATLTAIGPNANNIALVENLHYAARTLTDTNITVEGCTFDFPNWAAGAAGKGVNMWFVKGVKILNNKQYNGSDLSAMIGSVDTLEQGNSAYGITNGAYDHFWGGGHQRVVDNYAEVLGGPGYNAWGIQFTGTDISNSPAPINDVVAENNQIVFSGPAGSIGGPILLNGYGTGVVNDAIISHNLLTNTAPGVSSHGIYINGAGGRIVLDANNINGVTQAPSIQVDPTYSTPLATAYQITNNILNGCGFNPTAGAGANGVTYVANIQIASSNTTVSGNRENGCTGQMVSLTGTANTIGLNDDGTGADGAAFRIGTYTARLGSVATVGSGAVNAGAETVQSIAPSTGVASLTIGGDAGTFWTAPDLTVSAPTPNVATAMPATFGLSAANAPNIVSEGSGGLTVGQALTVTGGTLAPSGSAAVVEVTAIDGSGHPTGLTAYSAGSYSVLPYEPVSFAGGNGLTANVFFYVASTTVNNAGGPYTAAPSVSASNCGLGSCGSYTTTLNSAGGVASISGSGGTFTVAPALTVAPPVTVQAKARIGTFGAQPNSAGTIVTAGSGYTAGEQVHPQGGILAPGGSPATVTVTGVGTNGVPAGLQVASGGSYAVLPPDPVSLAGASGAGLAAHLNYSAQATQIIDPGQGYTSAPIVTASGCVGPAGGGSYCDAGSYTASLPPSTVAISGLPLCANAITGQLCVVAAGAGQAVEIK